VLGEEHVAELEQVSVFLENRPGCLADLARVLADRGVNLRALTIAETERFGIARLIADDAAAALAALEEAGLRAAVSRVVAVEVPDRPGGLAHLLAVFDGQVSVEYLYAAFQSDGGRRVMIMKLTPTERALELIETLHEG